MGMYVFKENPLTGVGIGSFVAHDLPSPHNFFVYGLAEMGLLFVLVLGNLIFLFAKGLTFNRWQAIYLMPALVLLTFNDRFLNLNPYPFVLIVLLFGISLKPYAAQQVIYRPRELRVSRRLLSTHAQGARAV